MKIAADTYRDEADRASMSPEWIVAQLQQAPPAVQASAPARVPERHDIFSPRDRFQARLPLQGRRNDSSQTLEWLCGPVPYIAGRPVVTILPGQLAPTNLFRPCGDSLARASEVALGASKELRAR